MLLLMRSLIRTSGLGEEDCWLGSMGADSDNNSWSNVSPTTSLFAVMLSGDVVSSAQAICILKITRMALKINDVNFNISIREY